MTFTLTTGNSGEPIWPGAVQEIGGGVQCSIFRDGGPTSPRRCSPVRSAWWDRLELTANPFVLYPSYQEIAACRLAQRVAEMRKTRSARTYPGRQAGGHPFMYFAQAWQWMFPLTELANYEPGPEDSIPARARARGVSPLRRPTTVCSTTTGTPAMLVALANFENNH